MYNPRLAYLFDRYLKKLCSGEEEKELMGWIADPSQADTVQRLIEQLIADTGEEREIPADKADTILQYVLDTKHKNFSAGEKEIPGTPPQFFAVTGVPATTPASGSVRALVVTGAVEASVPTIPRRSRWRAVAAAAAVILFGGLAIWLTQDQAVSPAPAPATSASGVALPGGDHAFLTLADGSVVQLDSLQDGALAVVGAGVAKQEGLLIYHTTSPEAVAPAYNTLSTPRGGQFSILLPDGSRVWLNASSSLYYPTAFTGERREVVLKGEAYFEIAHRPQQPFIVAAGDMQVEVLGTHFNINAYEDESQVRTSLLEGKVRLRSGQANSTLQPGQQASLGRGNGELKIREANMEQVVAWKNGLFQFEKAGIREIMRQISRWYNVEVSYAGKPTERAFDGKIRRSAELSKVLKILELSDVKFSVEGNHVTVH